MSSPATLRVKSTDEASQGPFVVINAEDFDPQRHEPFDAIEESQPDAEPKKRARGRKPNPETES